jgi:AraC-like DNA-binding protein
MDGTDLIEADEADLLSEAGVARLRAHPRFREAAESLAAVVLAHYEAEDIHDRWLLKDLGRASLCLGAAILDTYPGGLTTSGLAAVAAERQVCSRGRVLAFVHYALDSGRFVLATGSEPWVRRRLTLTPAFIEPMRRRLRGLLKATAVLAPEVEVALPRLTSDAAVQQANASIGLLLEMRPDLKRNPGGPLRQIFIARDGGMRILQHLLLRQAEARSRLLEAAPLSRAELSRRYGVSRTHVNRLLADAEAAGVLRLEGPDRVAFSAAFSDEVEAYFAGQFQVMRVVARTMVSAAA